MSEQIPRGYTKCTNTELIELWNKVCEETMRQHYIDYIPELYMFTSTRTWGWARYNCRVEYKKGSYRGEYNTIEYNKPIVSINREFLKDPQKALKTMCHEIAHVACYEKCKLDKTQHEVHSNLWRNIYYNIASQFGFNWSDITRCATYEGLSIKKPKVNKYTVYCPHCHKEFHYQRMCGAVEHPWTYIHNVCGYHLSKNPDGTN